MLYSNITEITNIILLKIMVLLPYQVCIRALQIDCFSYKIYSNKILRKLNKRLDNSKKSLA